MSDWQSCHGVLVRVAGAGVLLTGEPGSGKSSLALELIDRGHRLVSDDAPLLRRMSTGRIEGRCPDLLAGLLHVRGLGVLDLRRLFGPSAVIRRLRRLDLRVHLELQPPAPGPVHDEPEHTELLGVRLPLYRLCPSPGLARALWVECAARNRHRHGLAGRRLNAALEPERSCG
ncbi:MAG: hypothetical protein R3202_01460 [Candidatus Competibacterales bacterium]|nr:hypothetical protein [Candidatus Competibacterales bacterium]